MKELISSSSRSTALADAIDAVLLPTIEQALKEDSSVKINARYVVDLVKASPDTPSEVAKVISNRVPAVVSAFKRVAKKLDVNVSLEGKVPSSTTIAVYSKKK